MMFSAFFFAWCGKMGIFVRTFKMVLQTTIRQLKTAVLMKKTVTAILLMAIFLPAMMFADSFSTLWKQVDAARQKDLPQTTVALLGKIKEKATAEKAYGHLLKAELLTAKYKSTVSTDSIESLIQYFEKAAANAEISNPVLAAVYHCVLGHEYRNYPSLSDSSTVLSRRHFALSLAHPDLLAQTKTAGYEPMVNNGYDSRIFNHDMLSLLAAEAGDYRTAHDYYATHYNRAATMMMALNMLRQQRPERIDEWRKSRYVASLDSLINQYKDLPECGEVAIERYQYISSCSRTTDAERMACINNAVDKWGSWPRINRLRNEKSNLTSPWMSLHFDNTVTSPGGSLWGKVEICNVGKVTVTTTKLNVTGGDYGYRSDIDLDDNSKLKTLLIPSTRQTLTRNYAGIPEYVTKEDSMELKFPEPGVYLVEATADKIEAATDRMLCYVTDLFVINQAQAKGKIRYVVVNARSGQPVAGANLRLYYRKTGQNSPERTVNLTTDQNGEVIYQSTGERTTPDYIYAWTPADKAFPASHSYSYYSQGGRGGKATRVVLYTDRQVYRPGQTVRVALVNYEQDRQSAAPLKGKDVTLTLRDANGKEVSTKTVTTDAYGTASTDFVLPQGGVNGNYSVTDGKGAWRSFEVAEYKRPTFEVTLPEVKAEYHDGDTVVVKGMVKTYAGVPVSEGKVAYTVERAESFYGCWWRRNFGKDDKQLVSAETTTDKDGTFVMELPMELPEGGKNSYFRIRAQVKVTDGNGETHEAEMTLPLSAKATFLTCDLPDKALADSLTTLTFTQTNLAGLQVDNTVNYTIDGRPGTARTNQPVEINASDYASGEHALHAVCGNDTIDRKFVVFRLDDQRPAVKTKDWSYCTAEQFTSNGAPVYLQIGTSDENVHVCYTLFSEKGLLESGAFELSDEICTQRFTYQEDYGDMLVYNYAWVRDGKLYNHSVRIRRPLPDMKLAMKWSTFRDRLTPGKKEEWRLHITTPDGKPAKAQLMSVLYDKSLDQIKKHDWNLNVSFPTAFLQAQWRATETERGRLSLYKHLPSLKEFSLSFSSIPSDLLRWSTINVRGRNGYAIIDEFCGDNPVRISMTGSVNLAVKEEMAATDNMIVGASLSARKFKSAPMMKSADAGADSRSGAGEVQVRANLQETAFFYPALETDERGDVSLRFTLPESVTTWRFMGIAHDQSMRTAKIEGETVAQKDIMIQPNMPRFLRKGDVGMLTARVSNTTEKTLTGTARIIFIDPSSDKTIAQQSARFTVDASGTASVSFPVDVNKLTTDDNTVLVCKVVAEANGCSDGEQHYLPVLSAMQQVVNTLPFSINEGGEKVIDLDQTIRTQKNVREQKVTIEYADNPAWLMIQSLPSLQDDDAKNAIGLVGSFYANALAYQILQQSPRLHDVVNLWKQEQGRETTLTSALQKNQEVKDLLLEESPWMADADSESGQLKQLTELFDENVIGNRQNSLMKRLMKLQSADGSFSWYPGMPGSKIVTTDVAVTLLRLKRMTGMTLTSTGLNRDIVRSTDALKERALGYLQERMVADVNMMKRQAAKGYKPTTIGYSSLCQLYAFALDDKPLKGKYKAAQDYLMNILLGQPSLEDIRSKAVAAVVFARTGHPDKAREYVKSIKEYTVCTDLMGRYFDGERADYYWCDYRMPAQVLAVEAMKLVTPDDRQTITEMQRWILQQKHTQRWDSPVVGVDAVYAFFVPKDGEAPQLDVLAPCEKTQLLVDGKPLKTDTPTAGVGYVKVALGRPDVKTLTVRKPSKGTSWGAVYVTGEQPMTDIVSAASGLSVRRELIGNKSLKVGDKVTVRLTVKADRDYDFVQLQDRRAACLEPVEQTSGYRGGCYFDMKDTSTRCYLEKVRKGTSVIEIEYYIDRPGDYLNGAATVQCAYAPEYAGRDNGTVVSVKK